MAADARPVGGLVPAGSDPSAGIVCGRSDRTTQSHLFGNQTLGSSAPPIREDAIFLVASITKPIVSLGALLLVERGQLSLDDRVCEIVSSFRGRGKYGVTVRHLLTHTSGLPDMLPHNRELRESHSPLEAFLAGTCAAEMGSPPGRGVRYQSMGFALLGEIIRCATGKSWPDFLRIEIFEPLWMNDTSLRASRMVHIPDAKRRGSPRSAFRKTRRDSAADWGWNSHYWWGLAHRGGVFSTRSGPFRPHDALRRIARGDPHLLKGHRRSGHPKPATRHAADPAPIARPGPGVMDGDCIGPDSPPISATCWATDVRPHGCDRHGDVDGSRSRCVRRHPHDRTAGAARHVPGTTLKFGGRVAAVISRTSRHDCQFRLCRFFGGRCPAKGHDLSEIELTIAAFDLCFGDQALNGAARKAGSFEGTLPRLFLCEIGASARNGQPPKPLFSLACREGRESELAGFDTTSGGTPADITRVTARNVTVFTYRHSRHVSRSRGEPAADALEVAAPRRFPPPDRDIGSVSGWFQEGPCEFWFGAARFTAEATTELAQACGLHRAGGLRPGLLDPAVAAGTVGETGDVPTPPDDSPREALASDDEFTTTKLLESTDADLTAAMCRTRVKTWSC